VGLLLNLFVYEVGYMVITTAERGTGVAKRR
jgi:hypothetical protein